MWRHNINRRHDRQYRRDTVVIMQTIREDEPWTCDSSRGGSSTATTGVATLYERTAQPPAGAHPARTYRRTLSRKYSLKKNYYPSIYGRRKSSIQIVLVSDVIHAPSIQIALVTDVTHVKHTGRTGKRRHTHRVTFSLPTSTCTKSTEWAVWWCHLAKYSKRVKLRFVVCVHNSWYLLVTCLVCLFFLLVQTLRNKWMCEVAGGGGDGINDNR